MELCMHQADIPFCTHYTLYIKLNGSMQEAGKSIFLFFLALVIIF